MNPELRALIDSQHYDHAGILKIAEHLPAEDSLVDEWLAEAVKQTDYHVLILVGMAAMHLGRPVDARHLARGAPLLWYAPNLITFAMHCTGDLATHLITAVREMPMSGELATAAMFTAIVWSLENRQPLPLGMVADVRKMVRDFSNDYIALAYLYSISRLLPEEPIYQIIVKSRPEIKPIDHDDLRAKAQVLTDGYLATARLSVLATVPERYVHRSSSQYGPVRRAAERVGRNESCPCGSGRKYKHCCNGKDQERLLRSSIVPGKTIDEVCEAPEPYITLKLLPNYQAWEIAKFDPLKLQPEVVPEYLRSLAILPQPDAVVSAFERLGYREEFSDSWTWSCISAYRALRKDAVERLIAVRGDHATVVPLLPAGARLLLQRDDPAAFLQELEALSLDAVQSTDEDKLVSLGTGLMLMPTPALGIFVARSLIPLITDAHAIVVLHRILETHDRLNLAHDDPYADIVEKRLTEKALREQGKDSKPLREARIRLETKAAEVNQLRAELLRTRSEMERRARATAVAPTFRPTYAASSPPPDDSADLRRKVTALKGLLNERNAERTQLRHDIEKAQSELETTRSRAHPALPDETAYPHHDPELEHFLPSEDHGTQPVRLLTFPAKFNSTLDSFPRPVARTTMQMLGRLASGDPSAFAVVVRLKALRDIYRQRIGSEHRLLFRLHPTHLEVVDLINRRDLELRLKTLRAE